MREFLIYLNSLLLLSINTINNSEKMKLFSVRKLTRYMDYEWFNQSTNKGVYFVTRLKSNFC